MKGFNVLCSKFSVVSRLPSTAYRLLFIFFFLLPCFSLSQDLHFSQFTFSPLTLNPALTSAYKDLQLTINYKDQWQSVNAYSTSQFSFEMKLNQKDWIKMERMTSTFKQKLVKGLAFGLNVNSDKAGDGGMKTSSAVFSIAYHNLLNPKNTLSAGLIGGVLQRSVDQSALRWPSQYSGSGYDPALNPNENFAKSNFTHADFGAGILWSFGEGSRYLTANDHRSLNAGISVAHFNRPEISFLGSPEQLYMKWSFHTAAVYGIKNSNYSLAPSLLFTQQGPLREFMIGAFIKYKLKEESKYTGIIKSTMLSLGCFYRNEDAIIPGFQLEIDKYALGISYDFNISTLSPATSGKGGFEITLRFGNPSPFLYQRSNSRI
jgi:type IX secretion system PorP/SprF family membrane protein